MSSKAAKERRFRQKEQQRKHFEVPMKRFLQEKYPLIFDEYKAFYEALNRNHPYTRDLTKTCTFQTWISSLKQQDASNIIATALRQALGQEEVRKSDDENQQSSDQAAENEQSSEHSDDDLNDSNQTLATSEEKQDDDRDDSKQTLAASDQQADNLTFRVTDRERQNEANQAAGVLYDINDLADIMENVEAQVDEIINELAQDELLGAVLNEPVDEGIEMNPIDDIDIDIEPFDCQLEVENYDW